MIVYIPNTNIDDSSFIDLGAPENLGAKVLEERPKISGRIDFQENGMTAGIFEATKGKVEITMPFTEYATIIEGEVTITDEAGNSHTYKPGDSYFLKQGQVVIWDAQVPRVRKSFFNITQS
jgi:uncharacterized cupin superfamily protein